jgi:hypothetical protein
MTLMAEASDLAVVKAGTLDDPSWLEPEIEIFTGSPTHGPTIQTRPNAGLFPRSIPT